MKLILSMISIITMTHAGQVTDYLSEMDQHDRENIDLRQIAETLTIIQ